MINTAIAALTACTVVLVACSDGPLVTPEEQLVAADELLDGNIVVTPNPSGLAPLTAELTFKAKIPVNVTTEVLGAEPLRHEHPGASTHHAISIVGLYPDAENRVEVRLRDMAQTFAVDTLVIPTDTLPTFFPTVEVVVADRDRMEAGWTLSNLGIGEGRHFSSWPVMFDTHGDIRWYMNLSFLDDLAFVLKRAANGNFLFAQGFVLYEFDMLGRQLRRWDLPGLFSHHELVEKPDGNLLVAVGRVGWETMDDYIIEVDRVSGAIVNEWDLTELLDVYRRTYFDADVDWFHMNAIFYDELDDALIVSGRNQAAVVKITNRNDLVWILAAHKGWGLAGSEANGPATADFLLTAVDANGVPYGEAVQQGDEDAPDFRWPWGQHASMILPNGNVFLFDNGLNRNFDGDASPFSRGVEYEVDKAAMTVRQVWHYGEERGPEYYSPIISDVDLLPSSGNRMIMPGIVFGSDPRAYVTEVSHPGKEVLFEAIIHLKNLSGTAPGWGGFDIVYRSERLTPYP